MRLDAKFVGFLLSACCYGAPASWLATGPFGGAAEIVRTIPERPNVVVAATLHGLFYRSIDGGKSWENLFFPAQFAGVLHALEIDPRFPGVWYAGIESQNSAIAGVYKTNDGGRTWEALPGIRGRAVWSLATWPGQPDLVGAGTDEGVFISPDAGATWKRISPQSNRDLRPVVSLAFHPTAGGTIYAGTTHLPWRTQDGGARWESIHSGMIDDSDVFSIAVDARSPATVFASACSGVYRSRNGGSSWTRLGTPGGAFRTYLVTPDPRHPGLVFAGTSGGLLRSADGGGVWRIVSPHQVKSIAFDQIDRNKIHFASTTGGLMASHDRGETLRASDSGFVNRNFSAMTGSGDVMYASTIYEPGSGGVFRTADRGRTWARMASPGNNENALLLAAAPDDPNCLYAAGYRSLFRSIDGAKTWQSIAPPPGNPRSTAILALPGKALAAGSTSGLFRLAHGTWSKRAQADVPGAVELLQDSGRGAVAAVTNQGAFRSDDAGLSWTECGQPAANTVWYGLAADSGRDGTALAATSRGLYRSTDGCASWQLVRDGLRPATVTAVILHPRRPDEAFTAQDGGIMRTRDGGRSWRPLANEGRAYPKTLLVLPSAPQLLFGLFPRRGVLSIFISGNQDSNSGEKN